MPLFQELPPAPPSGSSTAPGVQLPPSTGYLPGDTPVAPPDFSAENIAEVLAEQDGESRNPFRAVWNPVARIRAKFYSDESGDVQPLQQRLSLFRSMLAEGRTPGLEQVYDFRLRWSDNQDWRVQLEDFDYAPDVEGEQTVTAAYPFDAARRPVLKWLEHPAEIPKKKLVELQDHLWKAGYFAPSVYEGDVPVHAGRYDTATQDAWTTLLKDAIMDRGRTPLAKLLRKRQREIKQMGGLEELYDLGGASSRSERAPLVIELSNPQDIANAAQATSQEVVGYEVPGIGEQMVPAVQGAEVGAQRAAYGAAETGGTVTAPASVASTTEQSLRERMPIEADAYTAVKLFDDLLSFMAAPSSIGS